MSQEYKKKIIDEFSLLEPTNFRIKLDDRRIFVCGGLVDVKEPFPPSFRHRFIDHIDLKTNPIQAISILAEEFKDYFKDGNYTDLLKFEEDIASTCSVVMIFLESPGSLVELGMFCNHPEYYKKLLIVAPEEKTEGGDSFIYLGPLKFIRSKDNNSVAVFPWPDPTIKGYPEEHLEDLLDVLSDKLIQLNSEEKFNPENHGHIAFLICEIIRICFPIAKGEIKAALKSLGFTDIHLARYLYLLKNLKYIDAIERSTSTFYFPISPHEDKVQFGRSKKSKQIEAKTLLISFRKFIATSRNDATARRRANVLSQLLNLEKKNES